MRKEKDEEKGESWSRISLFDFGMATDSQPGKAKAANTTAHQPPPLHQQPISRHQYKLKKTNKKQGKRNR